MSGGCISVKRNLKVKANIVISECFYSQNNPLVTALTILANKVSQTKLCLKV